MGGTGAGTSISSGGALELQDGITLAAEPISVSSTGSGLSATTGGIRNITGDNIITGTVTSAATSRINTDLGTLTLNNAGSLVLNASTTIGGVNNTLITGKVSGTNATFGITKDGNGTLTLSGTTNDYLGQTSVTSGIVKVNNVNSLGATSGNTVVNGGTVLLDSAGAYTINEPFNITGTGYNSLGTIRNLGKITTLNGTITLAGSATIASSGNNFSTSNDSLLITGAIDLGSAGTATNFILTTLVDRGMNISGIISGNTGGLTKTGLDTLVVSGAGANTYKGASVLSNGKIRIKKVSALGTLDAGTTINDGTTLLIDLSAFTLTEPLSIIGNGVLSGANYEGAIKTLYGKNSITGTITLLGNSKINIGSEYKVSNSSDSLNLSSISTGASSGFELTLSSNVGTKVIGVISGNGSIVKEGLDTLVLSAVNTYAGATKITAGCLRLGANYVLPSASTNSFIFNGGTFSSGGFTDTLGILSITDNSGIDIRYTPIHTLYFSEKANFTAGKTLTIYGWSGLVAETITKYGQSKGGDSILVLKTLLKRSGETSTSKTNTMTKYGQEITAAIFTNYRGKLFFTAASPFAATLLNQYELNRIIFHNDFSGTDYAASQNSSTKELVAGDAYVAPTEAQVAPTINQTTVTSITYAGATVGGTISAVGGVGVTINSSGVVWSTIPSPSVLLTTKTTNGPTTTGTFTGSATSLSTGTLYYARAYATYTMGTKTGTAYGPEITFTTLVAPNGLTSATAAPSALAIKNAYPSSTDGVYYIDLGPTGGIQQVYCLMDSKYDGGGWMLAMKAAETGNTFGYASAYWTSSTNNLNTASPSRLATLNTDAKYDVMNYYATGNDLMALWPDVANSPSANGSTTNSGSISGLTQWSWLAKNVLGGNTTMQAKLNGTQTSLISNPSGVASGSGTSTVFNFTGFGAGTYYPFTNQAGYSFYGFNYSGNATHSARWGFGWNNEADQGSNDVSGGIGLNQSAWSAGDSYGCCEGLYVGFKRQMKVEIYVR